MARASVGTICCRVSHAERVALKQQMHEAGFEYPSDFLRSKLSLPRGLGQLAPLPDGLSDLDDLSGITRAVYWLIDAVDRNTRLLRAYAKQTGIDVRDLEPVSHREGYEPPVEPQPQLEGGFARR